jgi:hypothetical protein
MTDQELLKGLTIIQGGEPLSFKVRDDGFVSVIAHDGRKSLVDLDYIHKILYPKPAAVPQEVQKTSGTSVTSGTSITSNPVKPSGGLPGSKKPYNQIIPTRAKGKSKPK